MQGPKKVSFTTLFPLLKHRSICTSWLGARAKGKYSSHHNLEVEFSANIKYLILLVCKTCLTSSTDSGDSQDKEFLFRWYLHDLLALSISPLTLTHVIPYLGKRYYVLGNLGKIGEILITAWWLHKASTISEAIYLAVIRISPIFPKISQNVSTFSKIQNHVVPRMPKRGQDFGAKLTGEGNFSVPRSENSTIAPLQRDISYLLIQRQPSFPFLVSCIFFPDQAQQLSFIILLERQNIVRV